MKLYEITTQYQEVLDDMRDAENGEALAEIADKLAKIEGSLEEKLDNCARVLRSLEAEADVFEQEAKRLSDKARLLANHADRFKNYIALCLGEGNQIKTPLFSFRWLTRESVEVLSPDLIPPQYQRTKTTVEPDKKMIMQDIQNGAEITGARLIKKHHLQIK